MNDLRCPQCNSRLYIKQPHHNIVFLLRGRKNFFNNPKGTQIYLHTAKCKCGEEYLIYFDCHCWNNHVTAVKNRIVRK